MNARTDLLRAHVYRAHALRGTEAIHQAARDVVDGWMLYPAVEAQLALERARALAVDLTDEERWYDMVEASMSRPRGPHPGADDMGAWIRESVDLLQSTYTNEMAVAA